MDPQTWTAFVGASLVVLAIPGPTVLLVAAYALSAGRSAALWTVLGVALGDLTAITAALLGMSALLSGGSAAFEVLRWVGALYLVYLGVQLWRAPVAPPSDRAARRASGPSMALHAFAVTATNPKSLLFFVAFLPQFLDASAPLGPQGAALAATFVGLAAANAALYALAAARLGARLRRPETRRLINRCGGAGLIGLGAAAASRPV